MKTLIIVLMLCLSVPLWAQTYEVVVRPVIQMATIDSIVTTVGKDSIRCLGTQKFASVVVGQYVWGKGIKWGTTVETLADTSKDSVLVLSTGATATDTLNILNFGYRESRAYQDGDFIGMPFKIDRSDGVLQSVVVIDSSGQGEPFDIVLFNDPDYAATPVRDSVQMSFAEGDQDNILGYVLVRDNWATLGSLESATINNIGLALPRGAVYGRLVARGTANYTSVGALLIRFRFVN